MFAFDSAWKIPLFPLFPVPCCRNWLGYLAKEMQHQYIYSTNENENFKKKGLNMWN